MALVLVTSAGFLVSKAAGAAAQSSKYSRMVADPYVSARKRATI